METQESNTSGRAFESAREMAGDVLEKAESAESEVLETVDKAQKAVGKVTPVPTEIGQVASPSELKGRLDWGEPALTILDVRDRDTYNKERITGAIPMSSADLADRAKQSLSTSRDLFVYGDSDEAVAMAVTQLRDAGFDRVSAVEGGLPAWKAIGGPIEGQSSL